MNKELTKEQQNGQQFVQFINFIKDIAINVKKYKECNYVVLYADGVKDADQEVLFKKETDMSTLLSTMVGHLCYVRFFEADKEHKSGEALFLQNKDLPASKLEMTKDGKVGIAKDGGTEDGNK